MEDYSEDEVVPPTWLNQEYFENVFREVEKSNTLKVTSFSIMPATKKGDHYGSIMFRVTIDYENQDQITVKNIIVKAMPEEEGHKKETLKDSHIFDTEIGIYNEVIPAFEQALRDLGDNTVFAPKLLHYSLHPHKILILEDLAPLGYKTHRNCNLNLEETKLVYSKIAKWHAISYKLHSENPKAFEKYCYGLTTLKNINDIPFLKDAIPNFLTMLHTCESLRSYEPYFQEMKPQFIRLLKDAYEEYVIRKQSDGYYVLCHGDLHAKNILIQHNLDTGKPQDILLIDFQISYLGPLCNDLIFTHATLINADVRLHFMEEIDMYYAQILKGTLHKMKFKGRIPNYEEIQKLRHKKKDFELGLYASFMPLWYGIQEFNGDIAAFWDSAEFRRNLYHIKGYRQEMEILLPRLLNNT